jgi:hypothetical protein
VAWPSKNPDDYREDLEKPVPPAPSRLARALSSLIFGGCSLAVTMSFGPGQRALIAVGAGIGLFGLSELEARRRARRAG